MVLSDGQKVALAQIKRIAEVEDSALRIINVEDKSDESDFLQIDISLDCTHYKYAEGGLKLHSRECVPPLGPV